MTIHLSVPLWLTFVRIVCRELKEHNRWKLIMIIWACWIFNNNSIISSFDNGFCSNFHQWINRCFCRSTYVRIIIISRVLNYTKNNNHLSKNTALMMTLLLLSHNDVQRDHTQEKLIWLYDWWTLNKSQWRIIDNEFFRKSKKDT